MSESNDAGLGQLPPKYNFAFNPYPEYQITHCPFCEGKTRHRKLPFFIHVKPLHFIVLDLACRYCPACDLLIASKHEFEHSLTEMFKQRDPTVIGNAYFVMGTVEKKAWQKEMQRPMAIADLPKHLHYFETYYPELRATQARWYPEGQEPSLKEPPPSEEWVRSDQFGDKR